MENTIHISTLLGKATTGAGNDSGCFNLQTVSTTLPQARWKNLLKCDGAAYPFEQHARYNSSFLFFLNVQKKSSKINVYLTANIKEFQQSSRFVFPRSSMTFTSSIAETVKLWRRAPWVRQADGAVSRGPVQHNSPGRHYKHLAPPAPVIHGCLLPSNRARREFARWRSDTTNNYIPTLLDGYVAAFETYP